MNVGTMRGLSTDRLLRLRSHQRADLRDTPRDLYPMGWEILQRRIALIDAELARRDAERPEIVELAPGYDPAAPLEAGLRPRWRPRRT